MQQAPKQAEQTEQKPPKKVDYIESDEEGAEIEMNTNVNIVSKDKVDAENRKAQKQVDDGATGWKLEGPKDAPSNAGPIISQPKPVNKTGEITFQKKGPPTFYTKNKQKRVDKDFPIIDASEKPDFESAPAKKDQADIGSFGAQAKPAATPVEEKKEATKPVFTSSKKKNLGGGDDIAAIQSSKQNYDFSSLGFSSASSKVNKGERNPEEESKEQKPPRQKREYNNEPKGEQPRKEQAAFEDDGDFQTVTEKKRRR